jgi:hypothetical protein
MPFFVASAPVVSFAPVVPFATVVPFTPAVPAMPLGSPPETSSERHKHHDERHRTHK